MALLLGIITPYSVKMTTRYRVECEPALYRVQLYIPLANHTRRTYNPPTGSVHRSASSSFPQITVCSLQVTRGIPAPRSSPAYHELTLWLTSNCAEWIKGLLAVPFVLHSQPTGVFESRTATVAQMAEEAHRRYAEIMQDVEIMIDDHSTKYSLGDALLYCNTDVRLSCASKGWTPRAVQTQVVGANHWVILHSPPSRRCI